MIRAEVDTQKGQITLHVDDRGADLLAEAARDAKSPAKVIIGDPGALLIVRHEDYVPASTRKDSHG